MPRGSAAERTESCGHEAARVIVTGAVFASGRSVRRSPRPFPSPRSAAMTENATDSARLRGFPPVLGDRPRILVLGSMPSVASLAAGAYYAHPRNRFWPVAGAVLGFDPALPYGRRVAALTASGVALWDTIASCEREGSLDSAILRPVPNDFAALLAARPTLGRICLNGGKAAAMWRRFALPELAAAGYPVERLDVRALPSTSPANARRSLDDLIALWRPALTLPEA